MFSPPPLRFCSFVLLSPAMSRVSVCHDNKRWEDIVSSANQLGCTDVLGWSVTWSKASTRVLISCCVLQPRERIRKGLACANCQNAPPPSPPLSSILPFSKQVAWEGDLLIRLSVCCSAPIMPCCAVMCRAVLCCAVLPLPALCQEVALCYAVPRCAVPCCHFLLCHEVVLCCAVLCRAVPCCAVPCCALLCSALAHRCCLCAASHVRSVCVCVAQDVKAGTVPADPLMQALLDRYLKRLSVNRATLQALFKAADSDGDGLLDRPQARAALTLAQPDLTDTSITTIWLEQDKVTMIMPRHISSGLFVATRHSQACGSCLICCTSRRHPKICCCAQGVT